MAEPSPDQERGTARATGRRLRQWLARATGTPSGTTAPVAVHADGSGYAVRLPRARAQVSDRFFIDYTLQDEAHLWRKPTHETVATTALTAHSGVGKSTLLYHLFRRLRHVHSSSFPFEFSPDLHPTSNIAVAFVPQNPPFVYHWRLRDVLPGDSAYYKSLIPSKPFDPGRRLSQFSGGEIRRIYASSCLEYLAASSAANAFLLLDETFDGVGPAELERCVKAIRERWSLGANGCALQILLVTHHNHEKLVKEVPDAVGLAMEIDSQRSSDNGIYVVVREAHRGQAS